MISTAFVTLIVLALGLLMGAFMLVGLLGMLMNKELSFGEFLVWVLAFLASIGKPVFFVLALLTILLGLGAPLSSWVVDLVGRQRLRLEDIEKFLRGVEKHPEMPYNYRKLAELYYQGGDWAQAVEWYEQAQKVGPDPHVAFWLDKARERQELGAGKPVLCLCGKLNARGASQCKYCGAPLRGSYELLIALGAGWGRLALLLIAAALLGAGMTLSLLRVGGGWLDGLLLLLGVGAAVLHFCATQAVGIQVRGTETSDLRPQTSDAEKKPPGKPPQEG
jgi:tetratricopeptide (TPR) repeat protein